MHESSCVATCTAKAPGVAALGRFESYGKIPGGALILLTWFLSLLLPAQALPAAAQIVGPNLNLTTAAGNQYEAAVAINPTDTNQIFVVSRNELGGLYAASSVDGGATWTTRWIATGAIGAGLLPRAYGNASVAWDSFGNLFLTYLAQGTVNSPATYVTLTMSTDGGATFVNPNGTGTAMLLPNSVSPYLVGDQPTVTVGPGSGGYPGSVWLTYWSQGGIWASGAGVSGTGAVSAFANALLPGQPAGVSFGDIAVGPNGEVIVTYGPDSGASGTIYTQSDADGLGPNSFGPPVAVAAVNIGGFTYIPAQPNWGIDPEAGLAYDRSAGPHEGRVHLVYTDAPAIGSYDTNIFVVHSDDQGATWSVPVRVNDDTGAASQFLPRISLDQSTGQIAVTWYDTRNSAANDTTQYFGAFSADGGMTFGANFQISAGTSNQANSVAALRKADYGDYTGNAFANGVLVPACADNSDSTGDNPDGATNFDVYTAIVEAPAVGPPDFSLAATPLSQTVLPGFSAAYNVTLTPMNGFAGAVSWGVTGLPSGATATFSGTSLTVATSALTPVGTYVLTITGTSGALSHTASVQLTVIAGFTLSATPAWRTCERGDNVTYKISVTDLAGFNGIVTYSVAGLPANVKGNFGPKSSASSTTLNVAVGDKAAPGTYGLAVSGTSGTLTQSIPIILTIK